jgi:glycosyltransferase involved in cell wall biosynthesis
MGLPTGRNSLDILREVRICIVSDWYPDSQNPYRCVFVHEFAKRTRRAGAKVIVVTTGSDFRTYVTNSEGVTVVRGPRFSPITFIMYAVLLHRVFRRCDIAHIHAIDTYGSLACIVASLIGKPTVATVHRDDVLRILPQRRFLDAVPSLPLLFLRVLTWTALKMTSCIVPVSESIRTLVLAAGGDPDRMIVIPNSVDETLFKPRSEVSCRRKLKLPADSKIILGVGNLVIRKGFEYVISAMPSVLRRVPNSLLVIAGDGPLRSALLRLVESSGLAGKVVLTGAIPTPELCLYYGAADVFVLASFGEGQPVVLLEAMASALPIVATEVPGNIDTIMNDQNGIVIPPFDISELANSICTILEDVSVSERMGIRSYQLYVSRFSEQCQMRAYARIYGGIQHMEEPRDG